VHAGRGAPPHTSRDFGSSLLAATRSAFDAANSFSSMSAFPRLKVGRAIMRGRLTATDRAPTARMHIGA